MDDKPNEHLHDHLHRHIRERAYEIWQNEGFPEGREDEHWQQARAEFADAREEAALAKSAAPGGAAGSEHATPTGIADMAAEGTQRG